MKVIGLTGSIATGKTTVLNIFKKFGYPTVSCDDVYHKLLKKDTFLKYKLVRTFGKQILDKKGNISLRSLSQVISKSIKNLYLLEKITHPRILKEVFHKVKQFASKYKNNKFCIIDVPLLFEKKLNNKFDYIITV
ncbi:MAG: dephospho-CoA kinase, partial [Endomicrobia bacterium]|nr:dephospho-CoA kinase [Endomicrobiia bacterium]